MEGKNQNILVALTAIVIVVAIFSSFGMNMFSNITIDLPQGTAAVTPTPVQGEGELTRVGVTPETVQDVIATLSRPEQYYRTVTVSYAGVDTPTVSQIWARDGWVRTSTVRPNGTTRYTLTGAGTCYWWYAGSSRWASAPAEADASDLEGAGIPAYEDVLDLDSRWITQASYTQYNGLSCIFVQWQQDGARQEYYISVEPGSLGLLVGAARYEGEEAVLTMTASAVQLNPTTMPSFQLPDGTDPTQ